MNNNIIKLKIQKLVNHYNAENYLHVIREAGILLKKNQTNTFLMNLIGSCFEKINQIQKAKKIFQDIIALDIKNIHAMNNLANIHKKLKEFNEAEKLYKKTLELNANFSSALQNYANLKFEFNEYDEAINLYKKAIMAEPNNFMIFYNLGLVYQAIGDFVNSEICLKKSIELKPDYTKADKILSRFTNYIKDHPHIANMNNRLLNLKLSEIQKTNILFALSKAYEDIDDYKKSYETLSEANSLIKKNSKYDIKNDQDLLNLIFDYFKKFDFKNHLSSDNKKKIIFIVGLPRSGTSLMEQILSSHSKVYGAGELSYLGDILKEELNNKTDFTKTYEINKISTQYINLIEHFITNEDFITDKNPLNFMWIGFIKILFPNARVIHMTRNIKDNYFSLFKNSFDGNVGWSYDKDDLLNFCKLYKKIMNFYNNKLPGFIINVEYENIVNNTKFEVKKILEFCNLEWENKCIEFHNNNRAIKTVSSAQARKPIYKSSLNSYEKFNSFLNKYYEELDKID
jgi:tetratricopeptide (TPR) repeat protein